MHGRFFRTGRGRGSYRASEVISLFIVSLLAGMLISGTAYLVDLVLRSLFG